MTRHHPEGRILQDQMQGASAAGVETEDGIGKEIWQDAHMQYNSLSTTLLPSSQFFLLDMPAQP